MQKMLFLINPVSGKKILDDCLMEVIEVFSAADFDINVYLTKSEDDMREQVTSRGGQFDIIVCCGGDGTLNLVTGAVYSAGLNTLVGYIPGGTTNDFAASRRIDTIATGAAHQIADGIVRDVDLGLLDDKPFVYVAAFGLFSEVSYQTSREMKQSIGHAAYVFEGIKSLAKAKPYNVVIKHDGETLKGDFIYGMVSNSKRVGGFEMPIMQNVLYDDGEMEVTLVRKPKNPSETQKLLNCLVTQVADDNMVYMFKTSHISYKSDDEIPWSLDGEYGGSYKESEINVKCAAVKMIF